MHRYFNFFMVCVYVCNVLSVLCQIMRSLPSIRLVFQILHIYVYFNRFSEISKCIFILSFEICLRSESVQVFYRSAISIFRTYLIY